MSTGHTKVSYQQRNTELPANVVELKVDIPIIQFILPTVNDPLRIVVARTIFDTNVAQPVC